MAPTKEDPTGLEKQLCFLGNEGVGTANTMHGVECSPALLALSGELASPSSHALRASGASPPVSSVH